MSRRAEKQLVLSVVAVSLSLPLVASSVAAKHTHHHYSNAQPARRRLLAQNEAGQAAAPKPGTAGVSQDQAAEGKKGGFFKRVMSVTGIKPDSKSEESDGARQPADKAVKANGVEDKKAVKANGGDDKKPVKANGDDENEPAKASAGDDKKAPPAKGAAEPPRASQTQPDNRKPAVRTATRDQVVTAIDTALLSVLRDLSRAAAESDQVQSLDGPQKTAVAAALNALDTALDQAQLDGNRIVGTDVLPKLEKSLTPESWESGVVVLPDKSAASMNVLWAKKVNGSVTVTIAGTCNCKTDEGNKVSSYVVVINGRSTLDSGFDIQSQTNVSYWLGKLTSISVDAGAAENEHYDARLEGYAGPVLPLLKALPTQDWLRRQALLAAAQQEAAPDAKKSNSAAAIGELRKADAAVQPPPPTPDAGSQKQAWAPAESPSNAGAPLEQAAVPVATALPQPAPAKGTAHKSMEVQARIPAADATVVVPERAVAGENATISVINGKQQPEGFVEVSINGSVLIANAAGKVIYQVPDDAIPGPSIQVSLKERPEAAPAGIYVLQPLVRPSSAETPKIDHVSSIATAGGVITIEGHNFDGNAEHDRITIDGQPARVVSASPVQLKAVLPDSLLPGSHNLLVTSNHLRSNAARCELVAVSVEPLGNKEKSSRFVVKVLGTQNKVRLKLQNESPQYIKLLKGTEMTVVTPGGANNLVTLTTQRIARGLARIAADVEGTQ